MAAVSWRPLAPNFSLLSVRFAACLLVGSLLVSASDDVNEKPTGEKHTGGLVCDGFCPTDIFFFAQLAIVADRRIDDSGNAETKRKQRKQKDAQDNKVHL